MLQKNVNPGESIQADFVYTALCTLADLGEMESEIDVQERDLRLLHKGTPCEIIPDAHPDRIYRGVPQPYSAAGQSPARRRASESHDPGSR